MEDNAIVKSASGTKLQSVKISLISLYSSSYIGLRFLNSALKKNGFDVNLIFFEEKNIVLFDKEKKILGFQDQDLSLLDLPIN
jgi:hypothetical protein